MATVSVKSTAIKSTKPLAGVVVANVAAAVNAAVIANAIANANVVANANAVTNANYVAGGC